MSGVIWGDTTISGGAIYMRNTTGIQNRYFHVAGVENKFTWNFKTGKIGQRLDAGFRFIYERANEDHMRGATPSSEVGTPTSNEFRNGYGLAVYAQHKFLISKKITATVGVRGEFFWFDRTFNMINSIDTLYGTRNFVGAVIPGVGLNYKPAEWINIFTGVHRGFSPPRVKDAINTSGVAVQLDPEDSWNVELGARFRVKDILTAEITGFYMDFLNQVVPQSVSSGSSSSALVNGGATRHAGVEFAFSYDLAKNIGWKKMSLGIEGGFTYQYAVYARDRFAFQAGDTLNLIHNSLPYAPPIMANMALFFQTDFGLNMRLSGNYISDQFTDDLNTVIATSDGRKGLIPGYFLMDANVAYKIPKIRTTIRLSLKNLTDQQYIVSRRPTGIKVGMPLLFMAGFEFQL
jgi:Fe(3+) dicitrate transport protein